MTPVLKSHRVRTVQGQLKKLEGARPEPVRGLTSPIHPQQSRGTANSASMGRSPERPGGQPKSHSFRWETRDLDRGQQQAEFCFSP